MSTFRTSNAASPRHPYPINTAPRGEPDGPTEPIKDRPPARVDDRRLLLVMAVAFLALNAAIVAIFVAWRAPSRMAAPAPALPAEQQQGRGEAYAVSYAQEPLRIQVGCSAVMFVDLDEPRANAGEGVSDLRYDSRCGAQPPRLTLAPGAAGGAQVKDADTDAAGCARAIRTSPIGPGASVEVRRGVVLCVLTAATPAEMALVEITEVGTTGTAGMRATSWKVSGA